MNEWLALFKLLPTNSKNMHTHRNIIFFIFSYMGKWVRSLPHQREKLFMKNERNDNKPLCSMSHITLNSNFIHQSNQTVRAIAFIGTIPCCSKLLHAVLLSNTPCSMLLTAVCCHFRNHIQHSMDTHISSVDLIPMGKFTFILFFIDGARKKTVGARLSIHNMWHIVKRFGVIIYVCIILKILQSNEQCKNIIKHTHKPWKWSKDSKQQTTCWLEQRTIIATDQHFYWTICFIQFYVIFSVRYA